MKVSLTGKNLYIANKKPQSVTSIERVDEVFMLKDEQGYLLTEGEINLKQDIHACLYCKQLKNITFIINKDTAFSTSLLVAEDALFETILGIVKEANPALELSEQNVKINGYAASVVAKLQEGVTITIMDTKEETGIKCCPVCGMQCDPNIPYCMECGAAV